MVEHRGLSNYLNWARTVYSPDAGALVISSLSFDATVTSLLTPLMHGSAARLLRPTEELSGADTEIRCSPGCLVKITPAHLSSLGKILKAEAAETSLGVIVIGGDALPASTAQLWREIQPGVRLINEYGPTEAVVGSVVHIVPDPIDLAMTIPIGRPISNTRIYLLDGHGQPVPQGVVGELYIGGAGVARGYLNRPELTAERFVRDPFSADGGRMYRTGDLARYLPDGNLEFLGRNDHQVKVRGYRIELGEIEARLAEHAAVREAVVVAREDAAGDKRLVAYVTTVVEATEATGLVATLRQHLADRLPAYMVPAAFVRLEALPLTRNGKLDRNALPAPDGDAVVHHGYEAPEGAIEQTLAAVGGELLGIERVGRYDDFFELGGHSLSAVQVAAAIEKMLARSLSPGLLFDAPTIEMLSRRLAAGSPR